MKLSTTISHKIEAATTKQLVAFTNHHAVSDADRVKTFTPKAKGVEHVAHIVSELIAQKALCPHCLDFADETTWEPIKKIESHDDHLHCLACGTDYREQSGAVYTGGKGGAVAGRTNPTFADTMRSSLKLDRRVEHIETGEVYANCFRLFKEAGLMSNGQSDTLSHRLYSAAKRGEQITCEMNGGTYRLVNVEGVEA